MSLKNLLILFISIEFLVEASENITASDDFIEEKSVVNPGDVFNGVYTECFMYLSYLCLQKKTLLYLKELNKLSEVSVIGEYVKFVKVNDTELVEVLEKAATEDLSFQIDKAVDRFFDSHILKFNALGKDINMAQTVEEFVGRKRKGGGGGGGGGHGGGGGDGGKKKMMMMAMMCMKMKFMMMVPAMMGMMGMMSFKGMMFSMMSFMISKMMLLMKILEKKGGGGGGGGGGGDGGWAAGGGGGGGGWMPAGGQDYGGGGGGGGGGYDANAQWQRRSIPDVTDNQPIIEHPQPIGEPIVSYVTPLVRYNNRMHPKKPNSILKNLNDEVIKIKEDRPKSRKKRGIVDMLQNAYLYWLNQVLGMNRYKKLQPKIPKNKVVNGVKYVYYPLRYIPKQKAPKELTQPIDTKNVTLTPIITAEDFNKGEIVEGAVESRMTKKLKGMQEMVSEAIEDNPWQ